MFSKCRDCRQPFFYHSGNCDDDCNIDPAGYLGFCSNNCQFAWHDKRRQEMATKYFLTLSDIDEIVRHCRVN